MPSDQALQRMIDEAEIRKVIGSVAMHTDSGDSDAYAQLFTEDAHLELRPEVGQQSVVPPTVGREAILAGNKQRRDSGMTGPGSGCVHAVQQGLVTLSGDTATAKTYVFVYKNANAKPDAMAVKVYNDELVRTPDGWRLAVRYIDPV